MSDSSNPHLASIAASLATMASIKKSRARSDFLTPLVLGTAFVVMVGCGFMMKRLIKYMDDNSDKSESG